MLSKSLVKGFSWSFVQLVITRALGFVLKILLARYLFPDDYGLIGMTMVFANLLIPIGELGFTAALIQRKEQEIAKDLLNATFTFSLALGITLYIVLFFLIAESVAEFYNRSEISGILKAVGLILIIQPFRSIPYAMLTRKLAFRQLAICEIVTESIAGILAIGLAVYGYGYWSLVLQVVLKHLLNVPMLQMFFPYFPSLQFKPGKVRSLVKFGVFSSGTNFLNEIIQNFDYLLLGKLAGARQLGLYSFSFILTDTFRSHLMNVVNKVMYPVYSLKQDDLDALKKFYKKVLKINLVLISPIMIFLMFFSPSFIGFLLGDRWSDSYHLIPILSLSVLIHLLSNSYSIVLRAIGRADLDFKIQLWKLLLFFIPSFYLLITWYGAVGAAIAVCLNKIVTVIVALFFLNKFIGLGLREYYYELRYVVVSIVLTSLGCWALVNLGLDGFYYGALPILLVYFPLLWLFEKDELISYIRLMKKVK
jgi:teichuronic acid exporter